MKFAPKTPAKSADFSVNLSLKIPRNLTNPLHQQKGVQISVPLKMKTVPQNFSQRDKLSPSDQILAQTLHTFNNYLLKAKLILLNYSTILTEPEVNNCFSIFTQSDLNRIRKETIKKRLVWLTGEFMREHEAVNSGCAKVRSLQYLQTWQMIVLIFLYRVL